jgi:uncharacterized protein (DUF4415 family)
MKNLSRLSKTQTQKLRDLAALPDSQIDTGDIPEWSEEDFARSVPSASLYKPRKLQITTRIDADVIAWLKSGGSSYQRRLNNILRMTMLAATAKVAGTKVAKTPPKGRVATRKRAGRK